MSRKKLRLDRRRFFLEIQPTLIRDPGGLAYCPILMRFLCCWWQNRVQDAASRTMLTMVLSEARGLSLFLVIRGGIACNG